MESPTNWIFFLGPLVIVNRFSGCYLKNMQVLFVAGGVVEAWQVLAEIGVEESISGDFRSSFGC